MAHNTTTRITAAALIAILFGGVQLQSTGNPTRQAGDILRTEQVAEPREPAAETSPAPELFEAETAPPAERHDDDLAAEQHDLTAEQQGLVDWATARFETAGLALPDIRFEFSATTIDCHGHKGLYYAAEQRLHMCSMEKKIMLHELAHAWANLELSDDDRERFVRFRGLAGWNDQSHSWGERGTEHAAEVIAWGLMDVAPHVRWVEDGVETFRLLTIPDSDVAELSAGFELLTGSESPYRSASEWQPTDAGFSPETLVRGQTG